MSTVPKTTTPPVRARVLVLDRWGTDPFSMQLTEQRQIVVASLQPVTVIDFYPATTNRQPKGEPRAF